MANNGYLPDTFRKVGNRIEDKEIMEGKFRYFKPTGYLSDR
jgi:hypothetical protein